MPEGGLELSSPPWFRNLTYGFYYRVKRIERIKLISYTHSAHTLLSGGRRKEQCVSRQQETHGESQVRSHRFAVELSEKLVVQNLDLCGLFVSESTKFFFPSSF